MIATLLRWTLDVRVASYLGAALAGEPEMGRCISTIAWRESRHELVSVHADDSWMQRSLGEGWSTRGAHGMVARFSLPGWWPWPSVLDVPLVSAYVATRRARAPRCRQVLGCVRWRSCDERGIPKGRHL
ncbi:MAG TPA: hypothetical protein VJP45_06155 [Candidatus Limnocylindria bacterium]|nr:hypothetical protein [Candidatus Limnocylindria bacterium]